MCYNVRNITFLERSVDTKTTSYVIYRPGRGFRSNKRDSLATNPSLNAAIVWARECYAKRAATKGDHVLPVIMEIDASDVLVAELTGEKS